MSIVLRNRLRKFYTGEKSLEMVGINLDDFKVWMENNFTVDMSWENHGNYWHIDHVVPCSWFDLTDKDECKICFHWSNMRPLEGSKNMSRQDTCSIQELLCQEIAAKSFRKSVDFKPLTTKLVRKLASGSS